MRLGVIRFSLAAAALASAPASACPEGHYEACVFGMCGCLPDGGTVVDAISRPWTEQVVVASGASLAQWIRASRATSTANARPIPAHVRAALTGYIDEQVLDRARYQVDDHGTLNLGSLTMTFGDAGAITLDDVIVFRNAADASGNVSLWAHELTHVKQYRDWGVEDFAISYVRNSGGIESPAYQVQNRYADWARSHRYGLGSPSPAFTVAVAAAAPMTPSPTPREVPTHPITVVNHCDRAVRLAVRYVPRLGSARSNRWTVQPSGDAVPLRDEAGDLVQAVFSSMSTDALGRDAAGRFAEVDEWRDGPAVATDVTGMTFDMRATWASVRGDDFELNIWCD